MIQASNYTTESTAIAVMPFPFAVVPSYFLPHRRHSSDVMPFSLAVVCPSAVISHPRIIPDLDPLVITNTTNHFRSIDKISSNCKCLGSPPWRSKFAVVPFQTCWKCCGAPLLTRPSTAIFAVPLLTSNSRPDDTSCHIVVILIILVILYRSKHRLMCDGSLGLPSWA